MRAKNRVISWCTGGAVLVAAGLGWRRAAYWSNVNTMGELYLFNNVLLTMPPCQLKFVLDTDLQAFRHSTVFPRPDHSDIPGVEFPYFSPHAFAYYEARIEWTRWLSRDWFVHSNQCYYSLQYATGMDSNFVWYNSARALGNFDVRPWLTIGVDVLGITSDAPPCRCLTGGVYKAKEHIHRSPFAPIDVSQPYMHCLHFTHTHTGTQVAHGLHCACEFYTHAHTQVAHGLHCACEFYTHAHTQVAHGLHCACEFCTRTPTSL
jgi:hypothetical protein